MMSRTENREFNRVHHDAPLLYVFQDSDSFYSATLCNYGEDGMCFESGYELEPGTEIVIMLDDYPRSVSGHEIQKRYNAIVKWCQSRPDTAAFFYRVGVKYCRIS